jgi:hypothetical protein
MQLLHDRFALLKRIAEGKDWERYLAGAPPLPAAAEMAGLAPHS